MRRDRVNSSFINKYQERKIDLSWINSNVKKEESCVFSHRMLSVLYHKLNVYEMLENDYACANSE